MWTARDALILVGAYLPASLLGALLAQLLPKGAGGMAGRPLLAQFIVYTLSVALVFAIARLTTAHPRQALGLTLPMRAAAFAIPGGPILAITLGLLGGALRAPNLDSTVKDWLADPASLPYVALFITLLAPFVEELIFRGFLQPIAIAATAPAPGILLTALAFALLHGPTYQWSWPHLVVMALAGAAFGAFRHLTGSTLAAALLHASYNATMLFAYLK
jgi:uncharacterized protein